MFEGIAKAPQQVRDDGEGCELRLFHEQHPAEAQPPFALVLFVFPLGELDEFHFKSGALGFEDLYVLIEPVLLWYVETENLAACRVNVLERIIEK